MDDINIDDLQREISAAESYLRRDPSSRPSSSLSISKPGNENRAQSAPLMTSAFGGDDSSSAPPETIGTDIMELNKILLRSQREEIENKPVDYLRPSALSSSLRSNHSDASARSMHSGSGSAAGTPSPAKSAHGHGSSPYVKNKYDDPTERDKLIAKLLSEHASKSATKASPGSPYRYSPAKTDGGSDSLNNSPSPNRQQLHTIGRYHAMQEQQATALQHAQQHEQKLFSTASPAPDSYSYSATYDQHQHAHATNKSRDRSESLASSGSSTPGRFTNYQYRGNDDLLQAYGSIESQGGENEDMLFFASEIGEAAAGAASGQSSGSSDSATAGAGGKGRSTEGPEKVVQIYGSYDGEEDSALYAPESEPIKCGDGGETVDMEMMSTAKAVHSSADEGAGGNGSSRGNSDDGNSNPHHHHHNHPRMHAHHRHNQGSDTLKYDSNEASVAWADQKQAEVSESIPALSRTLKRGVTVSAATDAKAVTTTTTTEVAVVPAITNGDGKKQPPARLVESRPKNWKYLKSKEQCEEESKRVARSKDEGGQYSFKPQLSAKVRREKRAGKTSKPSVVHAMFNNLPIPEPSEESKLESTMDGKDGHQQEGSKFELSRFEKSVKEHQRNVDARARLKQHVENVEVQSCSFKPRISRKAQELAHQARVQQMQLLQEEQIASRYFGAGALPQRLDPHSVGGALTAGLAGISPGDANADAAAVERSNPFSRLTEDSEGNLVYNEAVDDMYASHLGEQVSERLHREASTRAEQQRWLEQKVREARASELTFQPEISGQASKKYEKLRKEHGVAHVPIHERVGELQKFKQKRLQDLRAAIEEEEGRSNTYNPVIDKRSREIAERKRRDEENSRRVQIEKDVSEEMQMQADITAGNGHKVDRFSSGIAAALVDSNNDNTGPGNSALGPTTAAALAGFYADNDAEAALREKEMSNAVREDVESRLMKEGRATEMKMMYLQVMREKEIEEACKPATVSKGTDKIAENSRFVSATFAERQAMYRDKVKQKQAHRQMQVEHTASKWFNPNIGRSKSVVAAAHPERIVETEEERLHRLSVADVCEKQQHVAAMDRQVYKDVTFKPSLAKHTTKIGRASTLDDLVENPKGRAVRDAVRRRVEEEEYKECTHRPKVPQYHPEHEGGYDAGGRAGVELSRVQEHSYRSQLDSSMDFDPYRDLYGADLPHAGGPKDEEAPYMEASGRAYGLGHDESYQSHHTTAVAAVPAAVQLKQQINMREPEKMAKNIKTELQRKEEHRRTEIIRSELRELQECTFKPQINSYAGVDTSFSEGPTNIIRGLDRHLELQEATKRKKDLAREREAEVFGVRGVDSMRRLEDGTTVSKPFKLSEQDKRPSRAVLQLQEKETKDLTFHPQTENIKRRNDLRKATRASNANSKQKK